MADMDDFAAFMADIQTAEAVVGTGDEAKDAEAGDKRPRGEDRTWFALRKCFHACAAHAAVHC